MALPDRGVQCQPKVAGTWGTQPSAFAPVCAVIGHRRPGGQGSPEGRAVLSGQTSGQREAKPLRPWQKMGRQQDRACSALCDPRASPSQLHRKHSSSRLRRKGPTSWSYLRGEGAEGADLYVEPIYRKPHSLRARSNGRGQIPLVTTLSGTPCVPHTGLQAP